MKEFQDFLKSISDYIYNDGWYTQADYLVKECKNISDIEKYLIAHCYTEEETKRIINNILLP